jgi:hypothetical protein
MNGVDSIEMIRFDAAPWPTSLKATSVAATVLLAGTSLLLIRAIPRGTRVPFAEAFGRLMVFVPPLIALIALLYVVSGYEVGPKELRVRRLLWRTRVPLDRISRAWHDPDAMKRSLRVFGNGGLYSVTGVYQNRLLGRYRAFVTDPRRSVVLGLPDRIVVVSPADPGAFLEQLAAFHPSLRSNVAGRADLSGEPRGRFS